MKLSQLIKALQVLEDQGHGELPVFYRHSASGDCAELNSPRVTDHIEDTGPFDLDEVRNTFP